MLTDRIYNVPVLLSISAVLLAIMMFGEVVTNRDFSHISPSILLVFTLFLVTLDFSAGLLVYCTARRWRWSLIGAFFLGFGFVLIYALEFAQLFPASPTPMPKLFSMLGVLGLIISIMLMYCAHGEATHHPDTGNAGAHPLKYWPIALIAVFCLGVVLFIVDASTNSREQWLKIARHNAACFMEALGATEAKASTHQQ